MGDAAIGTRNCEFFALGFWTAIIDCGYNCSVMVTHKLIEWDGQVRSKKRFMLSDFKWLMLFEFMGGA